VMAAMSAFFYPLDNDRVVAGHAVPTVKDCPIVRFGLAVFSPYRLTFWPIMHNPP